jgi:hypothetical protein
MDSRQGWSEFLNHDTSAAFRFEIPETSVRQMVQEFQIGGTSLLRNPAGFERIGQQ